MANYPLRDGRLANGVGLDTPASCVAVLQALRGAGYGVEHIPADGDALVRLLAAGPTNELADRGRREVRVSLPLARYRELFAGLPAEVRRRVDGALGAARGAIRMSRAAASRSRCCRWATSSSGLQPARGYHIDPAATYHAPDLDPPHGYLAFYLWLRHEFGAHAVVHLGKHGSLEWLPGKATALSADCLPEAVLGPLPHLYPFIVNDPGEGTQAKRRAGAVIVDHLTPPLTRAESWGALAELEALVDEYHEAAGLDPRRLEHLRAAILDRSEGLGLARDLGIGRDAPPGEHLARLDNHLCELKELQIRDGLHVFGHAPAGEQLADLLVALLRLPRGAGDRGDASLLRALAQDLGLEWDPLGATLGDTWLGPRPSQLQALAPGRWRTAGDTVERLERLAKQLVTGERAAEAGWSRDSGGAGPAGAGPAPGCGILRWARAGRPAARARRPARRARAERRADARPARRAADRPELLFGRLPRGADAGGLAAGLAVGRADPASSICRPTAATRAGWRCRRGAPPTCAPAATTSRRRWR